MISRATCRLVAIEAMEAESEGKFTYHQIYEYIRDESISEMTNSLVERGPGFSRCRRFISITLVACFYVNVRLAIDPALAKLAKRFGNLRHQLAIII